MNWQTIMVIVALLFSATIGFILVWFALRRWRDVPGSLSFALLAAALGEWSLTYAFEIVSPSLEAKTLWAQFQYIGIASIPVGWFLFSQNYARRSNWLRWWSVLVMVTIPLITILFAFTNDLHGWLWATYKINSAGPLRTFDATYGRWWYIFFLYSYGLLFWGALTIYQGMRSFSVVYRWQFFVLLFALALPWLANGLYLIRASPIPQLDLGPFAFTISASIIGLGVFRYHLFDLLPVTRSAIIERLYTAAFVLDLKDRIVDINMPASDLLGKGTENLLGEPVIKKFDWWKDLGDQVSAIELHRDITLDTELGERIFHIQITPIWSQSQKLGGRLVMLHDVTADHLAEDAMALARIKSEFLAKVGHDLRTPLTSILGLTEMLDYGAYGQITERQRQAVGLLIQSTRQMIRLVNDLLLQARMERGTFQLEITEFSISEIVEQLIKSMAPQAEEKGLELAAEISRDVPEKLRGDPIRIYQILANLIENAIKYSSGGQVDVRVFCPDSGHYALEVKDAGIGIPKEKQTVIFDAFQQAHYDPERDAAGIGLGLSIVKQLTTIMHGLVQVQSEPGKGSVFTVILPIEERQAQDV